MFCHTVVPKLATAGDRRGRWRADRAHRLPGRASGGDRPSSGGQRLRRSGRDPLGRHRGAGRRGVYVRGPGPRSGWQPRPGVRGGRGDFRARAATGTTPAEWQGGAALRIADFGLGIADWGFWIADCGLGIADWGLRIGDWGLGIGDCGLWIGDCGLQFRGFDTESGNLL